MNKCIIQNENDEQRIIFALQNISSRENLYIRIVKKGFDIKEIYPSSVRNFIIRYDELTIGKTPLCGVFDISVESRSGMNKMILDSLQINIDPPVPSFVFSDYSDILGTNYTCSSVVNQIEFWLKFDTLVQEIEGELAAAASIGMNSLRVFLHEYVFRNSPEKMLANIEHFTAMCAKQNIRPLYVFF